MTRLNPWNLRPEEEANLFNPAFTGSLIYDFVKAFQHGKPAGAPLTYLPIALALSLHRSTRLRLPSSTLSLLHEWVQTNADLLIGMHGRIVGLLPYFREAMQFSLRQETLRFGVGHCVQVGERRAHFPAAFLRETTPEVLDTIRQAKFLARWLLKSGSESSVLALFGLRP